MPTSEMRTKRYTRTPRQRAFRLAYWQQTGFEFMDDTTVPFVDRLCWNLNWYEAHSREVFAKISHEAQEFYD